MDKLNMEEAKRTFLAANCSTFAMARENQPVYEKYLESQISKELENQWRREAFHELLADSAQKVMWKKISKLHELAKSIKMIDFYRLINNELGTILAVLDTLDQIVIAEIIIGRLSISERSGLIFESNDLGDKSLATEFAIRASTLLDNCDENCDFIERITNAKIKLSEVRSVLEIV